VKENYVNGWDDPRMPTISGFRRRGYTPESIRKFADRIGVAKRDNVIDVSLLEFSVREHLNQIAPRRLGVIDPVKVIITNYPENKLEQLDLINNPNDENSGHRDVPFTREIFIERNDFMEDPPKKFFRLGPDREVRLIGAYIIKCEGFKKDDDGKIEEIYCSYDPDTKSGGSGAQRKVKGTIHWVSAEKAVTAEIRLYDRLFLDEDPGGHKEADFKQFLNPDSLKVITNAKLEPSVANFNIGDKMQFQRLGYFCVDLDSSNEKMIINRTVPLRDGWAKKR
jgi:glutaminyl-tRNA synthetase